LLTIPEGGVEYYDAIIFHINFMMGKTKKPTAVKQWVPISKK